MMQLEWSNEANTGQADVHRVTMAVIDYILLTLFLKFINPNCSAISVQYEGQSVDIQTMALQIRAFLVSVFLAGWQHHREGHNRQNLVPPEGNHTECLPGIDWSLIHTAEN